MLEVTDVVSNHGGVIQFPRHHCQSLEHLAPPAALLVALQLQLVVLRRLTHIELRILQNPALCHRQFGGKVNQLHA